MMAHLTRQKFSNGGEVLPKPKPKIPQIKLYVDKLKTYLRAGAIEPDYAIQLLQGKMKEVGISEEELAKGYNVGGRVGLRAGTALASAPWFRGATGPNRTLKAPRGREMLEWLPEVGAGAAATTLALRDRTPPREEIINKAIAETGEGLVFGPDADAIEKEKERFRELLKPGEKKPIDQGTISTGTPRPEIKKEEPSVSPPVEIPRLPGFGEGLDRDEFNKPIILNLAKDKKEVKKKLEAIEPYRGAGFIGTSTKKDRTKDKEFLKVFEEYKNTHFGGNESAAAKSLNESREKIRAIRVRTTAGEDRKTGRISTTHEEIITTEVPDNPIRYIDATTAVKKDQNYFKDFLTKENKNEYMSPQNIANVLDFYFKDKSERDQFTAMLNKLDIKSKEVPGKRYKTYNFSDVVNELTKKNKGKKVKGEVLSVTERIEVENRLDPELYSAVLNTAKSRVNSLLKEEDLKLGLQIAPRYVIDDIGHTVSIKETDKFPKLFKNSNVNKINSLVYEDPLINQEVKKVTGYESKHTKWFEELNDMVGKEITKDQRTRLEDIKEEMEDNYLDLVDIISKPKKLKAKLKEARPDLKISDSYIEYLTGHTDRLGQIDINIPKVGEKFKSEDIFVDMSNVDEKYIIGYVDKINPEAKLFSDLSTKEKEIYEANVLAQNAEILGDYFRKIGLPESQIKSMQEEFYYPTTSYKIRKAQGGPVYGKYAKQIAGIS
jgi:hypothetical protein